MSKKVLLFILVFLFPISIFSTNAALAESQENSANSTDNSAAVLSSFVGEQRGELVESFDERREQHKILFYMGVVLLVFILLTAGFGVSMAMLGKEVFVQHMVCAGISVFLSIAHAVVAIVWFFPF